MTSRAPTTLLAALAAGCVENGFVGTPEQLIADIEVNPTFVVLDAVCTTTATPVTITNQGTTNLSVNEFSIDGEGWSVEAPAVPLTLAPDESATVAVLGWVGNAQLNIYSSDKADPIVSVGLIGTANSAPYSVISSPGEDDVLPTEGSLVLEGFVSDYEQDAGSLLATWVSDVSGEVGTAVPEANGRVSFEWDEDLRTPGPQTLQLQVVDSCGLFGEASVYFCQDGEFDISSLQNNAWHPEGDASVDQSTGTLSLGPALGSGFDVFSLYDSDWATLSFRVRTEAGSGFALVALDTARSTAWTGGDGCGLGFGDCGGATGLPGWALAFDLSAGDGNECAVAPSMGVYVDGEMSASIACESLPALADGAWHTVAVEVKDGSIRVSVDSVLRMDDAVPEIVPFSAFLGFTGAGGSYEIDELTFTDFTCAF